MHDREHLARPGEGDDVRGHEEQVGALGGEDDGEANLGPQSPLRNRQHVDAETCLRPRRQEAPPELRRRRGQPPANLPVTAVSGETFAVPPPEPGRVYLVSHEPMVPLGARAIRLPILMYHYVRIPPSTRVDRLGYRLSVSPAVFQSQMDWRITNGYHPDNFNQVCAYFAGTSPLPSRPVVITLDDGYQDLYATALPILQTHHFTAVAYIVSGFINQQGYATSDEVVQLDRAGIEIGSHTVSHPDLSRVSFASATFQVVESKRVLEDMLGHPVLDFAYPSGRYDAETIQAVEKAGYDTAVTTSGYPAMHTLQNRYTWSRVRVTGGEQLPEFIIGLGPSMNTVNTTRLSLESTPFSLQQQT